MFRPKILLSLIVAGLVLVVFIYSASFVVAGDNTGQGFTITPPIFELAANPGDKLDEVVSIFNSGNGDLSIEVTIENLRPMGEKGQVQVVGESEDSLPSLKDWIKIKTTNFDIGKDATKNINYSIEVPGNAPPGGHFATILFGTTASQESSGMGSVVSQKIGSLVLLTVAGETIESASITKFFPEKKLYWNNQTINFNLKIKNDGNTYIRPRGFLAITNFWGKKIAEIEVDGKNILPGATREIPLEYSPKRSFGPYTATLALVYGNSNQTLNTSNGFTIIPWLVTSIVIVLLIIVILLRRRLLKAIMIILGKK